MKQPFIVTFLNYGSSGDEVYQDKPAIILADTIEDVLKDHFVQNSNGWNAENPSVAVQSMKCNHATLFLPEEELYFSYEQILLYREIDEPQELEEYYADIASNIPLEK